LKYVLLNMIPKLDLYYLGEEGERMKGNKKLRAQASDGPTIKIIECKIRDQEVIQTRDKRGRIVKCIWKPSREQKQAIKVSIVKRAPKKRTRKKAKAKYNTQELFEKLAKTHQKIADSLKNDKRQLAKRCYHQVLAENFAFLVKKGNGEETQENGSLNRIPPMFKGALIMTLPEEFKHISRRINELERENEKTRKY